VAGLYAFLSHPVGGRGTARLLQFGLNSCNQTSTDQIMHEAALSSNEAQRLAAVQKTRLIGTPAEERFDRITRLAKRLFGVPMAVIDIVGEKIAWLKSVQGFDGIEGIRKDSYCDHTVLFR
jgi:hypothetical protein